MLIFDTPICPKGLQIQVSAKNALLMLVCNTF